MDCNFDVMTFYMIMAVIWSVTVVAFLMKLLLPWGKAPTGTARTCLILTMISSAFSSVESILFICKVPFLSTNADGNDANHALSYIGTTFLSIALSLWASLWCDVAGALAGPSGAQGKHATLQLSIVRRGYLAVAILHVPFCLLRAATEFNIGLEHTESVQIWTAWLSISACCIFTVFAMQMWRFVARYLNNVKDSQKVQGLRTVTLVNLIEQMVYNLFLVAIGVLYFPEHSNRFGHVQLAYYTLLCGLYWMMHIQVLFFFLVVKSNDPFHSKTDLEQLMLCYHEDWHTKDAKNAVVVGSPTSKDAMAALGSVPPQFALQDESEFCESEL